MIIRLTQFVEKGLHMLKYLVKKIPFLKILIRNTAREEGKDEERRCAIAHLSVATTTTL